MTDPARRRLRLPSLGEIIAITALTISAIGLWDARQDRAETRTEKARPVAAAPLVLTASVAGDGALLRLAAVGSDRVIQTQTIRFPAALGIDPIELVGNARIEADWFAAPLRSAIPTPRPAGRLPVAITTRYTDGAAEREDVAIYDIGHQWRERLLQSDVPTLEGITLVARGGKDVQRRLDARWASAHPAKDAD